jgi:hypothetical protein
MSESDELPEAPWHALTVDQALAGEWVTPAVSYVDPVRRFCTMTGRPIARRYWRVVIDGEELAFSDPQEAVRYATYPKSTNGETVYTRQGEYGV